MTGLLLMVAGAAGVIWFAFLSWRALGGASQNIDAHDVSVKAPKAYRFAGRACALIFVIGLVRFFTT